MLDARIALLAALSTFVTALPAIAESAYPTPTRDGRERIYRTGACPSGFVGKGKFCEALHRDTRHAFPVIAGKVCPTGTFRSGGSCVAFH